MNLFDLRSALRLSFRRNLFDLRSDLRSALRLSFRRNLFTLRFALKLFSLIANRRLNGFLRNDKRRGGVERIIA